MSKSFRRSNPFLGIQFQTPSQKIDKTRQQSGILASHRPTPQDPLSQLSRRFRQIHRLNNGIPGHGVNFLRHEYELVIEMLTYEMSLAEHFGRESTSTFEHEAQHLVV
jgi:hypothetical protein